MNTVIHSRNSVKKWGGKSEDYQPIHDFIDSSKFAITDIRHRALLHNSAGPFICERVFGHTITNSDNKKIPVREIAEKHILEDLGFIPSLDHWFKNMKIQGWMSGTDRDRLKARGKVKKVIDFKKDEQ